MGYEGTVILNYRLVKKLGEGGFGAVYLAEHVDLGRRAACKILHQQFAGQPSVVERFFREARAVCAIGHRAIVAIENFGALPAGEPFYLMEFFPGSSLADAVKVRRLGSEQLVAIFDPIADALGAAHAQNIIHRDLKPDNIMVRFEGERVADVRLLDFGVAKLLELGDSAGSITGSAMGTPNFMAPEQAIDAKNVDVRADVYAFAATVFAAIAGRPPFVGSSVAAIMVAVQMDPPAPLRELVPEAPEALEAVLARCLAKAREYRPATVAAAWSEIRAILLAQPVARVGMRTPIPGGTSGVAPTEAPSIAGVADGAATAGASPRALATGVRGDPTAGASPRAFATAHGDPTAGASPRALGAATPPTAYPPPPTPAPVGEISRAPERPRSRAPIVVAGVVGVVAIGGVIAYLATRPAPPAADAAAGPGEMTAQQLEDGKKRLLGELAACDTGVLSATVRVAVAIAPSGDVALDAPEDGIRDLDPTVPFQTASRALACVKSLRASPFAASKGGGKTELDLVLHQRLAAKPKDDDARDQLRDALAAGCSDLGVDGATTVHLEVDAQGKPRIDGVSPPKGAPITDRFTKCLEDTVARTTFPAGPARGVDVAVALRGHAATTPDPELPPSELVAADRKLADLAHDRCTRADISGSLEVDYATKATGDIAITGSDWSILVGPATNAAAVATCVTDIARMGVKVKRNYKPTTHHMFIAFAVKPTTPPPPPPSKCDAGAFASVAANPATTAEVAQATLRALVACEGSLPAADYQRIKQALVAKTL